MKSTKDSSVGFMAAMAIALLTVVSIPAFVHSQSRANRNGPLGFYASSPSFSSRSRHVWVFSFYTKVSDGKGNIRHIMAESSISSLSFRVTRTGPHLISRNDNDYFFSEIRGPEYNFAHGLISSHHGGPFGQDNGNNALPG
jgi:hypothetical protein